MKRDLTSFDVHERARRFIALFRPQQSFDDKAAKDEVSAEERLWLRAHLESCASCREFAEVAGETIRALRAIPVMAGASLVSATRMRVRQRAQELQRRQERLRVIWVCSAAVTVCTAFNTALLWRGFAWMSQWLSQQGGQQWIGQQVHLSSPLFGLGFVTLLLMPAIVAGIILLARGTYMADHDGTFRA
ncbi:MAG: zf-HC2 domain-containing protein [Acidobacteriota bacterium]|nr:zf-HC2 domain-containing protein [Acidobacteriota bacterium]